MTRQHLVTYKTCSWHSRGLPGVNISSNLSYFSPHLPASLLFYQSSRHLGHSCGGGNTAKYTPVSHTGRGLFLGNEWSQVCGQDSSPDQWLGFKTTRKKGQAVPGKLDCSPPALRGDKACETPAVPAFLMSPRGAKCIWGLFGHLREPQTRGDVWNLALT